MLAFCALAMTTLGPRVAWCQDDTQSSTSTQDVELKAQGKAPVGGQPFPLSQSVKHECAPQPIRNYMCERLMSELAKFSAEPRDQAWAGRTEDGLRSSIERESPEVVVRALECRKSLCAIETVTPTFAEGYQGTNHALLARNGLIRVQDVPVGETDVNGVRVVVLAQVLLRRPGERAVRDR